MGSSQQQLEVEETGRLSGSPGKEGLEEGMASSVEERVEMN